MGDKKCQEGKKCGILAHFALCRIVVRSGPSLAANLASGRPAAAVVGHRHRPRAMAVVGTPSVGCQYYPQESAKLG
jgi:hypothetical protein